MKTIRFLNLFIAVALAAALLPSAAPAAAQATAPIANTGDYVPGEVVVVFENGGTAAAYSAQAKALAGQVGASVVSQANGMALLSLDPNADVAAAAAKLSGQSGVKSAEPNYIYRIPEQLSTPNRPAEITSVTRRTGTESTSVSVDALKAMRTVRNGRIAATYPNDSKLWYNWGWSWIGGDIISSNITLGKNVCVLDTGVDYTHPDLAVKVIKGYDFVNNDADPMDDNGHGTHVSGVIAAAKNNGVGIAGISTGKVVAVKVLNAQGWGTSFGIAKGIIFCANRLDVKVLSMSLGGGYSVAVDSAVYYAVYTKGMLVVAAAGNANTSTPSYPAGLSVYYPDRVLAVAAEDNGLTTSWGCRASYSNYGDWVSVVAPGTDIYSTLPAKTPFYLNFYEGFYAGYDYLSGTSMATPFVAAAAAMRWGYKPLDTNAMVGAAVRVSNYAINADGTCWPTSMAGTHEVNVAYLLDRGTGYGYTYNATTGLPLTGAQFQIYKGSYYGHPGTLLGSGIVSSAGSGFADVINLPVGSGYWGWVSSVQTLGPQWAFWHNGSRGIGGGLYVGFGSGYVPNKDGNFTTVGGWASGNDLDMYAWLPYTPNPIDPGQPAPFVVGLSGASFGFLEGDSTGTLLAFPFALYNREGGYMDAMPIESVTIAKRAAHAPLAANAALPYYAGDYWIGLTDYGQLSGSYSLLYTVSPYIYVWKDGKMLDGARGNCNNRWWFPWKLSSGTSGAVSLTFANICTSTAGPYAVANSFTGTSSSAGVHMKP